MGRRAARKIAGRGARRTSAADNNRWREERRGWEESQATGLGEGVAGDGSGRGRKRESQKSRIVSISGWVVKHE